VGESWSEGKSTNKKNPSSSPFLEGRELIHKKD
jgi:hypothetical protein